jgi:hypothetical protein
MVTGMSGPNGRLSLYLLPLAMLVLGVLWLPAASGGGVSQAQAQSCTAYSFGCNSGCTVGSSTGCQSTPVCPAGYTWNGSVCAQGTQPVCPGDYYWSGTACVQSTQSTCTSGYVWNGSFCSPVSQTSCVAGIYWSGVSCAGSGYGYCPNGSIPGGNGCGQAGYSNCAYSYAYPCQGYGSCTLDQSTNYSGCQTSCPNGYSSNGSACSPSLSPSCFNIPLQFGQSCTNGVVSCFIVMNNCSNAGAVTPTAQVSSYGSSSTAGSSACGGSVSGSQTSCNQGCSDGEIEPPNVPCPASAGGATLSGSPAYSPPGTQTPAVMPVPIAPGTVASVSASSVPGPALVSGSGTSTTQQCADGELEPPGVACPGASSPTGGSATSNPGATNSAGGAPCPGAQTPPPNVPCSPATGTPSAGAIPTTLAGAATRPPANGVNVKYPAGWNIISAPGGTSVDGTSGPMYGLPAGSASYVTVPSGGFLTAGQGYWAYFGSDTTDVVPETTAGSLTMSITLPAKTWYLIGNPGTATASVQGVDGLETWNPFTEEWNSESTLRPGQGAFAISYAGGEVTITVPQRSSLPG